MIKIILETLPPRINATYKRSNTNFYKSKEAAVLQESIGWEAKKQYRGKPLEDRLYVEIDFYYQDNRKDIDSSIKGLFDALEGILWKNDRQICEMRVSKLIDKQHPRVELMVDSLI